MCDVDGSTDELAYSPCASLVGANDYHEKHQAAGLANAPRTGQDIGTVYTANARERPWMSLCRARCENCDGSGRSSFSALTCCSSTILMRSYASAKSLSRLAQRAFAFCPSCQWHLQEDGG